MQWKVPERETGCYFLRCAKSNTKSTRDSVLRPRFKTLSIIFFVTFPAFIPTPAYGATRFFGCFEPVRKGNCSTDARLILFENGLLYCKLTGANVFEKGGRSLSLLRWEFVFFGMLIKCLEVSQFFGICQKL